MVSPATTRGRTQCYQWEWRPVTDIAIGTPPAKFDAQILLAQVTWQTVLGHNMLPIFEALRLYGTASLRSILFAYDYA